MAVYWSWAWGNETAVVLRSDAGFTSTQSSAAYWGPSTVDPYTYTGSPTRYSIALHASTTSVELPAQANNVGVTGAIACAVRGAKAFTALQYAMFYIISRDGAYGGQSYVLYNVNSLNLYVDSVFKESTGSYDWTSWHYVCFKWDMSTTTWSGQVYVDGAATTSLQTDTATAITDIAVLIRGGEATGPNTFFSGIVLHDNISDSSEVPKYVTRMQPNADGTNIGTWVAASAGADYVELDTPIAAASYTAEASPSVSDRVEVLTNASSSDIDTALGTTTGSIDAVTVHSISSGQNITARAIVGDQSGATETAGATVAVSSSPVYTSSTAVLRPTGATAWSGTDSPELIYEVVTI